MIPLFYRLQETILVIFSVRNILLQLLACLITYVIVMTGSDWAYFLVVHGSTVSTYLSPATAIGGMVPLFGIPILYAVAKARKNKELTTVAWTLTQAATLGWLLSSTYKAFTGRVQPPRIVEDTLFDMSHNWNFGFWEHGIFWGWPSSHTTVAFAMSFAIIYLYPKQKIVLWAALFYALYIGFGISMQIHWVSEFIAGAILGSIIGAAVGTHFRKKLSTTS